MTGINGKQPAINTTGVTGSNKATEAKAPKSDDLGKLAVIGNQVAAREAKAPPSQNLADATLQLIG